MSSQRPLILDLDFTLLHLELVPGSIEVPGRTRSAYIAPGTIKALDSLQNRFEIILATARSWDGTRWVSDGLHEHGVAVGGVVIEDGACLGKPGDLRPFVMSFDVEGLRTILEPNRTDWPAFEWQFDFEHCLVARCANGETAAQLHQIFEALEVLGSWDVRFFRDGRKVYILPRSANKWSALQQFLGAHAPLAAGVGDGDNDLVWLSQVAFPATFVDARPAVIESVHLRNGYIGGPRGHQAIEAVLLELGSKAGINV